MPDLAQRAGRRASVAVGLLPPASQAGMGQQRARRQSMAARPRLDQQADSGKSTADLNPPVSPFVRRMLRSSRPEEWSLKQWMLRI